MARTGSNGGIPGAGTVTDVTGINSVLTTPSPIIASGTVELVNDNATPGGGKGYGTDNFGAKGFVPILPGVFVTPYGTPIVATGPADYEIGLTGSGATLVDLSSFGGVVGDWVIFGDAGANCSNNVITLDSGPGNTIIGQTAAQTYPMNLDGEVLYVRLIDNSAGILTFKIQ